MMGAKDRGLGRGLKDVSSGLSRIDSASSKLDKTLGSSFLPKFLQSLPVYQLDALGRSVDSLSDKFSPRGGLTTSIEQFGISAAKSGRQAAFRMGGNLDAIAGKMQKVSSAAYGLNASAESAQAAYGALAEKFTEAEIAALGFANAQDMIRMSEMIGDFKGYVGVLDELADSWGFGAKGAKELMDDIYRIGGAFGQGEASVSQMGQTLDMLGEQFASFPDKVRPEMIRAAAENITALAGALSRSGFSADEAFDKSRELFKFLSGPKVNLGKILQGRDPGGDIFDSLVKLAPALGSVADAQAMLEKSPIQFMQTMAKTYKGMDKNSTEARYLQGVMSDLGLTWALDNDSLDAYLKTIVNADGTLNKTGKSLQQAANAAYQTGLTMDEQMERVKDMFETRMNKVASKELGSLVGRTRRAYGALGDIITDLASDRGPLGLLVTKMVAVRRIGLSALFPTFGALGDMALQAVVDMAPMLAALGSMGFRFEHLVAPLGWFNKMMLGIPGTLMGVLGPVALVAGGVALLGNAFGEGSVLSESFQKRIDALPESFMRVISWLSGDKLSKSMLEGFRGMTKGEQWDTVLSAGKALALRFWDGFRTSFLAGVNLLSGWLSSAGSFLWEKKGVVVEWLKAGWTYASQTAWPWIEEQMSNLWTGVVGVISSIDWKGIGSATWAWLTSGWEWAVDSAWPAIRKAVTTLYYRVAHFAGTVDWKELGMSVWGWFEKGADWLLTNGRKYGEKLLDFMESGAVWAFENFGKIWSAVEPWIKVAGTTIWGWIGQGLSAAGNAAELISTLAVKGADYIGQGLAGIAVFLEKMDAAGVVADLISGVGRILGAVFDAAFSAFTGYEVEPTVVTTPLERAFQNMGLAIGKIANFLTGFMREIFDQMWTKVTARVSEWWSDPSRTLWEKISEVLSNAGKGILIGAIFSESIRSAIFSGISAVGSWIQSSRIVSKLGKIQEALCQSVTPTSDCISNGLGGALAGATVPAAPLAAARSRIVDVSGRAYDMPALPPPASVPMAQGRLAGAWGKAKGYGAAGWNAAKGYGGQVMGRAGWGLGGLVAAQAIGGMISGGGEEGGVQDSAGRMIGDVGSGASLGFAVGGPWGALIGGAAGAAKGLYGLFDAAEARGEAEKKLARDVAGAKWVKNMEDSVKPFEESMKKNAKKFDESMKWFDTAMSESALSIQYVSDTYDSHVNQSQIQLAALSSVTAGLEAYVRGDAPLSPTQIGAMTGMMSALARQGGITAEQFQDFVTTGSLKGLEAQVVPLTAGIKAETEVITNADRIYALKMESEKLQYEAKLLKIKLKQDQGARDKAALEEKSVKLEADRQAALQVNAAMAPALAVALDSITKWNRSQAAERFMLYGSQGQSEGDKSLLKGLSQKEVEDLAILAPSLKAPAEAAVKTLTDTLAGLGESVPPLITAAIQSMATDVAAGQQVEIDQYSTAYRQTMADLDVIGADIAASSSDLSFAAAQLLIDTETAGNAFLEVERQANDQATIMRDTAAKARDDAMAAASAEQAAAAKRLADEAAAATKMEAYNKALGPTLASLNQSNVDLGKSIDGVVYNADMWSRAQAIRGQLDFALQTLDENRAAMGEAHYTAARGELLGGAPGLMESKEDPLKFATKIMKEYKIPGWSSGGISNARRSGDLSILHGRELVFPLDASPSQEAFAGLREAIGRYGNKASIDRSANKTRDAKQLIELVIDDERSQEELISVLREELAAVRGALGNRRYVLVDTKGKSVGAIEDRSKGAALGV